MKRKIISVLLILFIILSGFSGIKKIVKAEEQAYWTSYFGKDSDWYAGGSGKLVENSNMGFTAEIDEAGWGGVWGVQVKKIFDGYYQLRGEISFSITSTIDKYVYVKMQARNSESEEQVDSFWIYIPKNTTQYVKKKINPFSYDMISFGLGGDFGDCISDPDGVYRYSLLGENYKDKLANDADGNAESSYTITVSDFKLEGEHRGSVGDIDYLIEDNILKLSGAGDLATTFGSAPNFKAIHIGAGITTIVDKAFGDDLSELEYIIVENDRLSITNLGLSRNTTVYCNYDSAAYWFAKINGNSIVLLSEKPVEETTTEKVISTETKVQESVTSGEKESVKESTEKSAKVTKPAKVKFSVKAGKKKASLKWEKVTAVKGYTVYYKTSKKGTWKKLKTVSNKKTSYTKKKLKSGKTYYFTVKAYKKVNGKKVYGKYTTKKIKVK